MKITSRGIIEKTTGESNSVRITINMTWRIRMKLWLYNKFNRFGKRMGWTERPWFWKIMGCLMVAWVVNRSGTSVTMQ